MTKREHVFTFSGKRFTRFQKFVYFYQVKFLKVKDWYCQVNANMSTSEKIINPACLIYPLAYEHRSMLTIGLVTF
jgi:hypothetical protein